MDDIRKFYSLSDRSMHMNETGCLFLERDRCTVYEYRPHTCRIFPFKFRIEKQIVRIGIHELAEYTCFRKQPDWEKQLETVKSDIRNLLKSGLVDDIFDTEGI